VPKGRSQVLTSRSPLNKENGDGRKELGHRSVKIKATLLKKPFMACQFGKEKRKLANA